MDEVRSNDPAGNEPADRSGAVADPVGLRGAIDRATDLLDEAARQGFCQAENFYALFNQAREVLRGATEEGQRRGEGVDG